MYSCILAVLFILRIVKRSHLFAPKFAVVAKVFRGHAYSTDLIDIFVQRVKLGVAVFVK